MTTFNSFHTITRPAAAAMTEDDDRKAGKFTGGQIAVCGDAEKSDGLIRVLNSVDAANDPVSLEVDGFPLARIGAAVLVDALLTPDANGKLVTAATGETYSYRALKAGAAEDDLIPVKFELGVAP